MPGLQELAGRSGRSKEQAFRHRQVQRLLVRLLQQSGQGSSEDAPRQIHLGFGLLGLGQAADAHVGVEPNVAIWLCLQNNNYWAPATKRHEMAIYRDWVKDRNTPVYLYLYTTFPEWFGVWNGFTAFPGFNARHIGQEMKMYYADGVRGVAPENISTQLNTYLYNQMSFDAAQDPEQILSEFFTLYYGSAAVPMRKLWLEIEDTFANSANYPEEVQKEDKDFHQTEEMAWKYLGTTERMSRWAGYMAEAKATAKTDLEKARVQLFETGEWEPMLKAKRRYDLKAAHQAEVDQLKKLPPPASRIPKLAAPANGDLERVDWVKGETVKLERNAFGYPIPGRQCEATILHDGKYLYIRLQERMDTKKLTATNAPFLFDHWEVFLAAKRGETPYRQIGISTNGTFQGLVYGEAAAWDNGVRAVSDIQGGLWCVRLCLPLANVMPGGLKSGQILYLNVIRGSSWGEENMAYSPTFSSSFHEVSRCAVPCGVILAKRQRNCPRLAKIERRERSMCTRAAFYRLSCLACACWVAVFSGNASACGAESFGSFDGKPFSASWKTFKTKSLWAEVNSLGGVTVKFLATEDTTAQPYGSMQIGLPGQQGAYWKNVKAVVLPHDSGLIVEGINNAGIAVEQELQFGDRSVKCLYTAGGPISLRGQFPSAWPANWFSANSSEGKIQGELWGTYAPLTVQESLDFTYLYRRIRIALPKTVGMTLTSPTDLYGGATSPSPQRLHLPKARAAR